MTERRNTVLIALATVVLAIAGFTYDGAIGPRPLEASGCGQFNGKACASDCTRECTNGGGCCSWAHYYYSNPTVLD